ncbi:hypothetical protein ACMD2_25713 [Ananas comosus]|uniref:Uncharacterized protein n=1 Tax=Ananas comosus TaxID=4615 RepID=A0A199VTP7_ANACO|nr:hypothetical protein ACMD2_25713 [Ananas comosus]
MSRKSCSSMIWATKRTWGKLLDIYRKQKTLSSFDTKPEGLEEVPSITFSSTVTPLAFLAPEADEEALLEDIWKGKVTSSEENYSSNDQMKGVDDLGDKHMVKYLPASSKDPLQVYSGVGESKDKLNSLTSGLDKDDIAPAVSESDVYCLESSSSFDVSAKLPDDSNLLFDTPFIDSTPKPTKFYQNSVSEVKSLEDDNFYQNSVSNDSNVRYKKDVRMVPTDSFTDTLCTSKTLERYQRCCYNSQDSSASDRETQVFHMDRNDYYGGESCSLNLFQIILLKLGDLFYWNLHSLRMSLREL